MVMKERCIATNGDAGCRRVLLQRQAVSRSRILKRKAYSRCGERIWPILLLLSFDYNYSSCFLPWPTFRYHSGSTPLHWYWWLRRDVVLIGGIGLDCFHANHSLNLQRLTCDPKHANIYGEMTTDSIRHYIPAPLRRHIFDLLHSALHPSARSTDRLIRQRYVWRNMHRYATH